MPSTTFSQSAIFTITLAIFVLIFSKKIYPPLILFFYLILSPSETYGIGMSFFSSPYLVYIFNASLTVSAIVSFLNLWKERNSSSVKFRLFFAGLLGAILAFLVYLSMVFYDGKNFLAFSDARYFTGPYAFIIALAYYRDNYARLLFVVLVYLQTLLGLSLILFPDGPWHIFNAVNYFDKNLKFLYMRDDFSLYGSRLSGQFANTIQLGFYSAISLALGIYMAAANKHFKSKIVGVAFGVIGFWLQLISVTRGIFIALIFSGILILSHIRGTIKLVLILIVMFIILPSLLIRVTSLNLSPALEPMLYRIQELTTYFDESNRDAYLREPRMQILQRSMVRVLDKPLFGYGGDFSEMARAVKGKPHQAPVFFMMMYGIPSGIIILLLLLLAIASDFKREQPRFRSAKNIITDNYFFVRHCRNLCSVFGWVVFIVAMTNEMTGKSFMWVALAIAIVPWAESMIGMRSKNISNG